MLFDVLFDLLMRFLIIAADPVVGVLTVERSVDAVLAVDRVDVHVREYRILQAPNQTVQNAEANQLLVQVDQAIAEAQTQIFHRDAGIHCTDELEHRTEAHFVGLVTPDEFEAFLLQLLVLD